LKGEKEKIIEEVIIEDLKEKKKVFLSFVKLVIVSPFKKKR
jgi:hypothetical protein